jgi:hypothetical protein
VPRRWIIALSSVAAGCLVTYGLAVAGVWSIRQQQARLDAEVFTSDEPWPPGPRIHISEPPSSAFRDPIPEYQLWLATQYPRPTQDQVWIQSVTDATRTANTLVVSTSLAPGKTAVEPGLNICTSALEFIANNPNRNLRAVAVTGADQGNLFAGSLDRPCEMQPHLRSRI